MTAALLTLFLSAGLCGVYTAVARKWQILDHPNSRSSHDLPTPHGGGVAIFAALIAGAFCTYVFSGIAWQGEYVLLMAVAVILVAIGVIDDLRGLSVPLRFALYASCCAVTVDLFYPFFSYPTAPALILGLVATLGLLWLLNLYNFMDGIDGFAAVQCIVACVCTSLIVLVRGGDIAYVQFCLLLAAAHAGFLIWNWPPARLFMGDAGSVTCGFLLGALALLGSVQNVLPLTCWLILLGCFIVDASSTLVRRMLAGERFWRPHRQHAYQRLSRHFGSHLPVVFILLAICSLWLFPLAWLSAIYPKYGVLLVILAYLPLVAGMAKTGRLG